MKREIEIKKLKKKEKEALIATYSSLPTFHSEKVE